MAWRSNKKGLAIVGVFLFLMGVVVPAAFGLLTEKAMELGVGDLLDKSTNWDASNIANSTYFVDKNWRFVDRETNTSYQFTISDIVYDDTSDMDLSLLDTTGTIYASNTFTSDYLHYWIVMNKTAVKDVDKIVVLVKIEDPGQLVLDDAQIYVKLLDMTWGEDYQFVEGPFNATDAYNHTLHVEIPIDAVKRLKIDASADNPAIYISIAPKDGKVINLNNVVLGVRVELYDVKKVNATAASNIMLATSGILGWLGALAATPYWNPIANREHRNVRRVGRAVKRRIPRRRR